MKKILIIEDDVMIAESIQNHLNTWGYEAHIAKNFQDILADVSRVTPDLILLDISLPSYNGFYWCKEIRKLFQMPIIFLSSMADNMNIVMAMEMGGDDFIAKPFDMTVLTAKIGAMIRRSYTMAGQMNVLDYKGVILNLADTNLSYQGNTVELSKTEFQITKLLMENAGSVVSRDMIMMKLWDGDDFIDDNTLSVNVARIRKKLKDLGADDFIKTKKGIGYLV